jgi:FixJ family two-component response regulator
MLSIQSSYGRVLAWPDASGTASLARGEPVAAEAAAPAAVVHIVGLDEDAALLSDWLTGVGLAVRSHALLGDFIGAQGGEAASCLVVDARIACGPDVDLGKFLQRLGVDCPVVMSAHGADVRLAVLAMKTGAFDFVERPFREGDILAAIDAAIRAASERRPAAVREAQVRARFSTLSRRERQVMALVTTGKLNKQVAGDLGVSEVTVKAHRGVMMRKMGARSLPDLVRMVDAIGEAATLLAA